MHPRSLALLLIPFLLFAGSRKQDETGGRVFQQIDSIVKTLSSITGLEEEHPVPYGRMTQPQLRKFLAHRIKTTLKPKEIYADELTLKLFGMVPADFDLKGSTVDLLTEQAAAFYDYEEKRLFLLNVASFTSEETTLAHELAHALADQHFNLEKFVEDNDNEDDENLAHTAVVEGQASWVMLAFQLRQQGSKGAPSAALLGSIEEVPDSATAEYPVLQQSPLYIQQSLLFPYSEGTKFFDAVYRKMGKAAFKQVFTDPPEDTAQILHPALYFAHVKPTEPEVPNPDFHGGAKTITEGSLGEFDQHVILWRFTGKPNAMALSPHVRGSQFRIVQTSKHRKKSSILEYVSEWDSEGSAAKYFAAYKTVLRKKWKDCDATRDSAKLFAGTGGSGYFVTKVKGRLVTSIEGIPEERDWKPLLSSGD
jgi:hypothetical protein